MNVENFLRVLGGEGEGKVLHSGSADHVLVGQEIRQTTHTKDDIEKTLMNTKKLKGQC